jgi:hypothetical protein
MQIHYVIWYIYQYNDNMTIYILLLYTYELLDLKMENILLKDGVIERAHHNNNNSNNRVNYEPASTRIKSLTSQS